MLYTNNIIEYKRPVKGKKKPRKPKDPRKQNGPVITTDL